MNREPAARRRRGQREGATAVEFALVALPFFILLLGILEIGLLLLTDALLETAASSASRQIRTGQAQEAQLTRDNIRTRLCAEMSVLANDCPSRTFIDIRVIDDFAPTVPDPFKNGAFDDSELKYEPGRSGQRVLVRIWYEQPIVTPLIAQALTRSTDGRVMLNTTLAFRNEPF